MNPVTGPVKRVCQVGRMCTGIPLRANASVATILVTALIYSVCLPLAQGAEKEGAHALSWNLSGFSRSQTKASALVSIGQGKIHGWRWRAFAFRNVQQGSSSAVCVEIVTQHRVGSTLAVAAGSPECARIGSGAAKVVIARTNLSKLHRSIIAGVSGEMVRHLELGFRPGPSDLLAMRQLSRKQQGRSGLAPLTFGSAVIGGGRCLEKIIGRDAYDEVLFETPPRVCADAARGTGHLVPRDVPTGLESGRVAGLSAIRPPR